VRKRKWRGQAPKYFGLEPPIETVIETIVNLDKLLSIGNRGHTDRDAILANP